MPVQENALIAEFNARRDEDAFAALVKQHITMVYATALRQVGDSHAAEEIAQNAFVALAESCGKLGSHPTIAGWLYQTTLNKSREWLRSETRRHRREQAAMDMNAAKAEGDSVWAAMLPMLDEALLKLSESDRLAVILYYMEEQSFREVGFVLGLSEDGARKRVNRCVDELGRFFRSCGFSMLSNASVAPLLAQTVHAVPAGFASSAASAALAAAHLAGAASTFSISKGALKIMAWSKTKIGMSAAAVLLLSTGTGAWFLYGNQIKHHFVIAAGKRAVANHLATPIDLTSFYGASFPENESQTTHPVFAECPHGFQVLNHVPLEVNGMLFLWGARNAASKITFPKKVLGIAVDQMFQTLYVYHGAFYPSADKSPVCEVVFHYENGATATNQMLYGSDIVEWAARPGKKANTPDAAHHKTSNDPSGPNSKAAWVGGTIDRGKKHPARFCLTAIANPFPSMKVTEMDWYSCENQTAACIMAMTVGKAGLME